MTDSVAVVVAWVDPDEAVVVMLVVVTGVQPATSAVTRQIIRNNLAL